jgi:hypothetical protein
LEGFLAENLLPGFEISCRLVQRLAAEEGLSEAQKGEVATLQKVLTRLQHLTQKAKAGNLKAEDPGDTL